MTALRRSLSTAALGAALLLLAGPALAQSSGARLGIKAGINISTLAGEDVDDANSRTGLMLGGFAEAPLSSTVSLQPELLYTRKGAETSFEGGNAAFKLDYLQLPVLFRVNIPTGGASSLRFQASDGGTVSVRPHLYAGPSLAFKLSCGLSGSEGGVTVNVDCEEFDANVSDTDFSLVIGGGVSIGDFAAGVRYDLGLSNIAPENETAVRNRTFSVYAAYGFRLN